MTVNMATGATARAVARSCTACSHARSFHVTAIPAAGGPKQKKRVLPARLRLADDFTPPKPETRRRRRIRDSDGSSRWASPAPSTKPTAPSRPSNPPPSRLASASGLRPATADITDIELIPQSQSFASPPLSAGLLHMVHAQLGASAKPTYIQSLAMQHFLLHEEAQAQASSKRKGKGKAVAFPSDGQGSETLLAAETGSGKTMAYLLPLLHTLKATEATARQENLQDPDTLHTPLVRPRAILLAPTHELARQLAASAKALCHVDKLRVLCLSSGGWVQSLKEDVGALQTEARSSDLSIPPPSRPHVDLIVATPSRLLDVCKSEDERAADMRAYRERKDAERLSGRSADAEQRSLDRAPALWKQRLVGLERVRTVVVDEADALFDRDFGPSTRAVLHLVREAAEARQQGRGDGGEETDAAQLMRAVGVGSEPSIPDTSAPRVAPYDLILASATIPHSLSTYLSTHHPSLRVLRSPGLHRLPRTLAPTFVDPGGSKHAAIAAQLRKVFDTHAARVAAAARNGQLLEPRLREAPRVLIFVNKRRSVELLSNYLESRGIDNIAMTGDTPGRSLRTNSHLAGFLASQKPSGRAEAELDSDAHDEGAEQPSDGSSPELVLADASSPESVPADATSTLEPALAARWGVPRPNTAPRVLITTSLLSRGLDFSSSLTHVFLPDVARAGSASAGPGGGGALSTASSALDLLHRAGRAGRAGRKGRVVLFDARSASDRPLRNRTGKTVGRVRGHLERVFEELKR